MRQVQQKKNESLSSGRPSGHVEQGATQEEIELVRNVFLPPSQSPPRVVVFAGVVSSDGCNHVCGRAAEALAGIVSGSVCIVDSNLRGGPSLHQYFDVPNLKGLTESTLQPGPIKQFAQQVTMDNLWLLTSGFHRLDPEPFLSSESLFSRIAEMRVEFDHVLVAGPPVILYSDAALVGRLFDGFVLVLEANSTRREQALKAREDLEAADVKLLGAVLNNRTFPIPSAVYSRL